MSDLDGDSDILEHDSSDDDDLELLLHMTRGKNKNPLGTAENSLFKVVREEIVPDYDKKTFLENFRISHEAVENISKGFEQSDQYKRHSGGYGKISAMSQVLIFLWFIGHETAHFRNAADKFNVTVSSLHRIIQRVGIYLSNLLSEVIKWPDDKEKAEIEQQFRDNGFPGVIGVVDSSHIKIEKPISNPKSYFNKMHGFYSVQIQIVCDFKKTIRDVFVGYPGSESVSTMFQSSPLYTNLEERCSNYYLLGGSGYPLKRNLLTSFKNQSQLNSKEKNYNARLLKNHSVIEHCFNMLKQKFSQLYNLKLKDMTYITHLIRAACVLYNISINEEIILDENVTKPDKMLSSQNTDSKENEDDVDAKRIRDNVVESLDALATDAASVSSDRAEMSDFNSGTSDTDANYIPSSDEESDSLGSPEYRKRIKDENCFEYTIRGYNENEFLKHFRVSRHIAEDLAEQFKNSQYFHYQSGGNGKLGSFQQIVIYLWFVGHEAVRFRDVAERFRVSISTLFKIIRKATLFVSNLSNEIIKWPSEQEKTEIEKYFRQHDFPGVIGVIDGGHVKIDKPKNDPDSYLNRNHQFSIQLQIVCDHQRRIRDLFVGFPGSVNDILVFRASPLAATLEEKCRDQYILGDSEYPCLRNLLTPFRNRGQLTRQQMNFNSKLSKNRFKVKQCFDLLKQKFRQLYHIKLKNIPDIVHFIRACCVLHNMALQDNFQYEQQGIVNQEECNSESDLDEDEDEEDRKGTEVRNHVASILRL